MPRHSMASHTLGPCPWRSQFCGKYDWAKCHNSATQQNNMTLDLRRRSGLGGPCRICALVSHGAHTLISTQKRPNFQASTCGKVVASKGSCRPRCEYLLSPPSSVQHVKWKELRRETSVA